MQGAPIEEKRSGKRVTMNKKSLYATDGKQGNWARRDRKPPSLQGEETPKGQGADSPCTNVASESQQGQNNSDRIRRWTMETLVR